MTTAYVISAVTQPREKCLHCSPIREREVPVRSLVIALVIAEVGLPRTKRIPFIVLTGFLQLQLD
jgi:hypothetical protein